MVCWCRLCSLEASAEMMSIVAATLANGGFLLDVVLVFDAATQWALVGTNPVTGDRVYDERIVANCLSLM